MNDKQFRSSVGIKQLPFYFPMVAWLFNLCHGWSRYVWGKRFSSRERCHKWQPWWNRKVVLFDFIMVIQACFSFYNALDTSYLQLLKSSC